MNKPDPVRRDSKPEVDPNLQIKFTIIFGILALIPFVLFYFFGISNTNSKKTATGIQKPQEPPTALFKDITKEAGMNFVHINGAAGEKLLPETMGGGCAFFDFDNDGDQDIILVSSSTWPWTNPQPPRSSLALYENDGRGHFRDVTTGSGLEVAIYGMGVGTGDFDNDGLVDLYITAVGGNKLFKNLGGGKFQDVTQSAGVGGPTNQWSTSCAWFDYDRDGDLDLFVCNYVQWSREIDLQLDYRLPKIGRAYGPPMNFAGTFPVLYRNDGGGKFTDVSEAAAIRVTNKATGMPMAKSLGVAPVDVDNDGWLDLVVANDTVQNFLFHNNHNGTFTEQGGKSGVAFDRFGTTRGAMGIDAARIQDNDTLAISIGNFANEMTALYVQQEPLFFTDQALDAGIGTASTSALTFGVFFFDYDLDGFPDLLTANGHIEPEIHKLHPNQTYAQPAQLFWNKSGASKPGGFVLVPPEKCGADLYQPIVGRGSAYADIDGDGDLDVLIMQLGGPAILLRNDQKLNHHWARFKLIGSKSNRDAIGAWIKLRSGKKTISRQVMAARGYLSQSELPVTIGLGELNKIDEAQVVWPDGSRESLSGVKMDQLNIIRQKE